MAGYAVKAIEGIGEVHALRLRQAGVRTTAALLARAASPAGRSSLAEATGLDESRLLKWANMADLMRIRGVAEEYAELLEAAGVDTVKELRTRNAANLHARIMEVNAERRLVRQLPSRPAVVGWIDQAKHLPPVLSY